MSRDEDIMNCEDYKIAKLSDSEFNDNSGHVDDCAACQEFSAEFAAFDEKLALAMDLDVPPLSMPDLAALETDSVVPLTPRGASSPTKPTIVRYALAASVLVAAFVGFQLFNSDHSVASLESQVLAHVDHEPQALLPSVTPVDSRTLKKVVPSTIGTMNHNAGLITYAETCPINGKAVPHLVIQGAHGPITILLMPDEEIGENKVLDGENVHGFLLKVGKGSIAIIGERDEQLDRVKENVVNSVAWDI